jgi:CBS domain-containing protein
MSVPAITVGGNDSVDEVSNMFASRGINRAPVVNSEGQIIGIVSRGDIMRASVIGDSE